MRTTKTCDMCATRVSGSRHKVRFHKDMGSVFCSDGCLTRYAQKNDFDMYETVWYKQDEWEQETIASILDRDIVQQDIS